MPPGDSTGGSRCTSGAQFATDRANPDGTEHDGSANNRRRLGRSRRLDCGCRAWVRRSKVHPIRMSATSRSEWSTGCRVPAVAGCFTVREVMAIYHISRYTAYEQARLFLDDGPGHGIPCIRWVTAFASPSHGSRPTSASPHAEDVRIGDAPASLPRPEIHPAEQAEHPPIGVNEWLPCVVSPGRSDRLGDSGHRCPLQKLSTRGAGSGDRGLGLARACRIESDD